MENIYAKVTTALNEDVLGCKVGKIKRHADEKLSVSYMLHPSIPMQHYNDDYHLLEHEVQVDIWADYEVSIHSTIEKVIQLMKENGFMLVSIRADIYEPDTNIIHKPILFSYLEKIERK